MCQPRPDPRRSRYLVVLGADDRRFGLVVDDVRDSEEIVVKPLDRRLKRLAAFSGATILGDGRVALILDVIGLAEQARLHAEPSDSIAATSSVCTDAGSLPANSSMGTCCEFAGRVSLETQFGVSGHGDSLPPRRPGAVP